jgi:uncharacterized RDD family membrane protein YckC
VVVTVCSGCGCVTSEGTLSCPQCSGRADVIAQPAKAAGTSASQAILTQTTRPEEIYASIWRRFFAALFDAFLASAILSPATVLLVWVMEAYHSEIGLSEFKSRTAMGTAVVLLWIVCFGLYCASAESSIHQATPGKRLLKLKVVSISYGRLTFQQATGRYYAKFLSTFVLLAGFVIAVFHSRKQSLHDMIAGTLVVRSE